MRKPSLVRRAENSSTSSVAASAEADPLLLVRRKRHSSCQIEGAKESVTLIRRRLIGFSRCPDSARDPVGARNWQYNDSYIHTVCEDVILIFAFKSVYR